MTVVHAVVLSWRDTEQTSRCLGSLLEEPGVSTVHLVDNESTGQLRALADAAVGRVALIEVPENRGFAGGVNLGLAAALDGGAELVLCLNNDAVLTPGALAAMVAALAGGPELGMVGPTVVAPDGAALSTGAHFSARAMKVSDTASAPTNSLTWACVLLRSRMLREVGLLDERFFMYWEDVEFAVRVRRAGVGLRVVPDAVVEHAIGSSHGRAGSRIAMYSAAGLVTLAGILGPTSWPAAAWRITGRFVRALVQGRVDEAVAVLRGIRWAMIAGPAWRRASGPAPRV